MYVSGGKKKEKEKAIKPNAFYLGIAAALMFIFSFLISMSIGSVGASFSETLRILVDYVINPAISRDAQDSMAVILVNVRMPRVILSAMVGAALSIAGSALQGLLKNPLADGSTLGITSGGALGAVLSLVWGIKVPGFLQLGTAVTSILFSFISILFIMALSYKIDKVLSSQTIILTGVIFSMFAGSLTSFLVAVSGESLKQVVFWSMGSFSGRGWPHVRLMLPFFIAGSIVLMCLTWELNAFSLGEEQARYIGVNTKKTKLIILIVVSVLVGISVAVSGTIGFVGLVVPHITRLLTGPDYKKLLPLSMFFGASFLMLTDLLSRTVLSPAELPIGVVTSFIGAVLFIYIFYNQSGRNTR